MVTQFKMNCHGGREGGREGGKEAWMEGGREGGRGEKGEERGYTLLAICIDRHTAQYYLACSTAKYSPSDI